MSLVLSVDITDRMIETIVTKAKNYGLGWIADVSFDALNHTVEVDVNPDYVGPEVNPHYNLTRYVIANAIERVVLELAPVNSMVRSDVTRAAREDEPRALDSEDSDRLLQTACFGKQRF